METLQQALAAAVTETARVVGAISDEQLPGPTPCAGTPVAGLLDHLDGLALAFALAAQKRPAGGADASAAALTPDWRARIPERLAALAEAWREPAAWEGTAEAGGVAMPAPAMAAVAVDEVLVHGWDLAAATGQEYRPDAGATAAAAEFVIEATGDGPPQEGLFGPPVAVPADAPAFDRLLGATGRDPAWRPPG
ncbi:TIGR03086 family metal-binding protein [Trujillonella endophytica]|uniref:TIGR03086 family protein n=1 Tax=Trujillonella endophytica TaxID=673521 RepID=A0A1H8WMK1_9ACTN|nr:TIGR03086 family metal-binding protein [Trujillella endophytica]SEP28829.1 TIGR03086 family protein [Trujillella endophytica]